MVCRAWTLISEDSRAQGMYGFHVREAFSGLVAFGPVDPLMA
jgi:hypothetical protein